MKTTKTIQSTPIYVSGLDNQEVLNAVKTLLVSRSEKADKLIREFDFLKENEKDLLNVFMKCDVNDIIKDVVRNRIDYLTLEEQLVIRGFLCGLKSEFVGSF